MNQCLDHDLSLFLSGIVRSCRGGLKTAKGPTSYGHATRYCLTRRTRPFHGFGSLWTIAATYNNAENSMKNIQELPNYVRHRASISHQIQPLQATHASFQPSTKHHPPFHNFSLQTSVFFSPSCSVYIPEKPSAVSGRSPQSSNTPQRQFRNRCCVS
jgi:hypothetical protein